MLLLKRTAFGVSARCPQQRASPIARCALPSLRVRPGHKVLSTHQHGDSTIVPRASTTMGGTTSMFQAADGQETEVLGWQRAVSKVILGALFAGLVVCLGLIWGQAPSPLLVQGTAFAQVVDGMGGSVLANVAATLTKQQAVALGAAVFMFLSTAAGPMITLGNRNRPAAPVQPPSAATSSTNVTSSQLAAAAAVRPAVAVAATLATPPAVKPSTVTAASVSRVSAPSAPAAQPAAARPSLASRAAALRSGPLAPAEPTTIAPPSGDLSRPTKSGRMPMPVAAAVAAPPAPVVPSLDRPGKTRYASPAAETSTAASPLTAGSPSPGPSGLSESSMSTRSPSPAATVVRPGARSRSPSPSSSPSPTPEQLSPSRVMPDGSVLYTNQQLASIDEADVIAILASKSPSASPGVRGNRAGRVESPAVVTAMAAVSASSTDPPAVKASSPALDAAAAPAASFSRGGGSSRTPSEQPAASDAGAASAAAGNGKVSSDRPSRSRGVGLEQPVVVVAAAAWAAVEVFQNMTKPRSNSA